MKNDYEIRGDVTSIDEAEATIKEARAVHMPFSKEAVGL